jgi:hypothetical protein
VGKIDGSIEKTEIIIRVDEPLMDGFSRVAVGFDASEALQNVSDTRGGDGMSGTRKSAVSLRRFV